MIRQEKQAFNRLSCALRILSPRLCLAFSKVVKSGKAVKREQGGVAILL